MTPKNKENFSNIAFFFSTIVFLLSLLSLILSPYMSAKLYLGKQEIETDFNYTINLTKVHYTGMAFLESNKKDEGNDYKIIRYTVEVTVTNLTDWKIIDVQKITFLGNEEFAFENEYPNTRNGVSVECKLVSCVKKYPSTFILNIVITVFSSFVVAFMLLSEVSFKKKKTSLAT